jgi:2-hydroxychromene-2-carboxylate isomerase
MKQGVPIEFWFSVGSTYTYLTVARIDGVSANFDVEFTWRPFDVVRIMMEQKNLPFSNKPIKAAYMWRDIERRAARYGIPARVPVPYPLPDLELANRIAVLASMEGWCGAYVKAAYHLWFAEGYGVGGAENNAISLRNLGQDGERVLALARSEAVGDELARATNEARAKNIFGSPSFVIGSELFWGDDRLEDAVGWHKHGTLALPSHDAN